MVGERVCAGRVRNGANREPEVGRKQPGVTEGGKKVSTEEWKERHTRGKRNGIIKAVKEKRS